MGPFDPQRHRLPAEWEPHDACWMAWPRNQDAWGSEDLFLRAKDTYAEVANAIANFEPVKLITPEAELEEVRKKVGEGVELYPATIEHEWMRDHGPTFVVDRKEQRAIGIDWGFNGYGMKALPCHETSRLNRSLLEKLGLERWSCPMNLEGGSIHWDGAGTLLTTDECLLNDNRNPHMSKADIEEVFRDYLGIEKTIWLPYGVEDDDTDGHIDEVACFAGEGTVLALTEEDSADGNYRRLKANMEVLSSATDAEGRPLKVITLPQPSRETHPVRGVRLSKSYANLYIANGGVVMPMFGDEHADDRAKEILRDVFSDRELVAADGLPIVWGGGCVHCITQQQPSVRIS